MTDKLQQHRLKNGMVVLGEPMEGVESAAFCFLVPAGAARLRDGLGGAANVIADWIFRGAGERNSRQLGDALDGLGLHRHCSVGSEHISLTGALQAGNLDPALSLYADIILRPKLEAEQFEYSLQLGLAELAGLDDEPRQKVMLKLYERFYPQPLGRSPLGTAKELEALDAERCRQIVAEKFDVSQMIMGVAGKYDFDAVCGRMEELFAVEQPRQSGDVQPGEKQAGYSHEQYEGAQVHIGLMTPTVPVSDERCYQAMGAVGVLSGGMSARLFTEVREKRGLCYAVGARYHTLRDFAGVACYAGTTPEKAQQTRDVIAAEFRRLYEDIEPEELERGKAGLKSMLILQSESTSRRAAGIARDYYLLHRVRSLEEIKEKIEQLSVESVTGFLQTEGFGEFTVVTVGPRGLQ